MISHDPIRDHGDFYQTNLLWKQMIEKKDALENVLSEDNFKLLQKQFAHIQKVFDGVVNIFKKMYGNGEFYFTYGEAQKFTDRKEFTDAFKNKVIFFSNTNKQNTPLIGGETKRGLQDQITEKNTQSIKIVPPIVDKLITYIVNEIQKSPDNISYFIFSPKKEESKKIFEDLCKNNINKQAAVLVENITGGIGKNIFKAKQTKNKIII